MGETEEDFVRGGERQNERSETFNIQAAGGSSGTQTTNGARNPAAQRGIHDRRPSREHFVRQPFDVSVVPNEANPREM